MKSFNPVRNLFFALVILFHQHASADDEHFYGGSMGYKMDRLTDGRNQVTIELITGWVLGNGPCGPACSNADVGKSTRRTRTQMLASNPTYFGSYTIRYRNETTHHTEIRDINTIFNNSYNETVIAISEAGKWEQELLHFSFIMPNSTSEIDINFHGASWRWLSKLQTLSHSSVHWHFQTRVSSAIRSDTGKANASPRFIAKPFYRVQLGTVTQIRIPAVDDDGDIVKCEVAIFVEGGDISRFPAPNVTVHENCTVFIDASVSYNYTDDTWIAIPLNIRDYNRKKIDYGRNMYWSYSFSLSTTAVQFAVQVLANLTTPKFVNPTLEGNHVFIMYADTTLRTDVYAEATENTTIESFTAIGIQQERFYVSPLEQDQKRPRVKFSTLLWKPPVGEIGRHIVCLDVSDNTGVDSAERRCFIMEVRGDAFNYTTKNVAGKPYFVDIPSPDQVVNCKIKATCVVALHISSSVEVTEISVTKSYIDKYQLGPIQSVLHKGENMYKVELSFEHFSHGKVQICFMARNKNGSESENSCIQSQIDPPDPCSSAPCQNSATCEIDKDTGGFRCSCLPWYSGKLCSIKKDPCKPNPCVEENTIMCVAINNILCYCKTGFTGQTCDINIDDCTNNACNGHGTCKDEVNRRDCECFERYNGTKCEFDRCPFQTAGFMSCPADNGNTFIFYIVISPCRNMHVIKIRISRRNNDIGDLRVVVVSCESNDGCSLNTCHEQGVCSKGGHCSCPYGFSGQHCETRKCNLSGIATDVEIVSPTVKVGSKIICYAKEGVILPCNIRIYLTVKSGSSANVIAETTEDLHRFISVGQVQNSSVIPGISNLYTSDVTISGRTNSTKLQYVCINADSGTYNSSTCYELSFTANLADTTSLAHEQKNATVKFVQPTLKDHSRILCKAAYMCRVLLYTSISSNRPSCNGSSTTSKSGSISSGRCNKGDIDNDEDDPDTAAKSTDPCCQEVISSTPEVTVYHAHPRGPSCVTEASFTFTNAGEYDICFLSATSNYQQLCYKVGVYDKNSDPCASSPCQNNGHCFHTDHSHYKCLCPDNYVGDKCERGPCQPAENNCQNKAYCQTDNGNATCICRAGFSGQTCDQDPLSVHQTSPEFTDTAQPTMIPCVIFQPCSMTLILTGSSGHTPTVSAGYVDNSLLLEEIETTDRHPIQANYQTHIKFKPFGLGIKDMCIQIKDINGVNRDELCFKVRVISDVISIYGFKDRPHFVEPSLPTDADVECPADGPCHILYNVTAGVGNENECVTFHPHLPDDFVNFYLFSSCGECTKGAGNSNCTVDVSIVNGMTDVGMQRRFCFSLGIDGSTTEGETRCVNITITDQTAAISKKGCQILECRNGGFCDGHIPSKPLCYCRTGYSGNNCEKAEVNTVLMGSQTQSFFGDVAVPSEIECTVNQTCYIPFQIVSKSGTIPKVLLGFVDAGLKVHTPSLKSSSDLGTIFEGYAVGVANKSGHSRVCIQTRVNSKTEDEICVSVNIGSVGEKTAKTRPYFLAPTIPTYSTVLCEVEKPCHFNTHFTKGEMFGLPGICPTMKETSQSSGKRVHIFGSILQAGDCVTDVSYIPLLTDTEHTLCVQIALPGMKGEIRCFIIKPVSDIIQAVLSPCRGKTCANGGQCTANLTLTPYKVQCVCPYGYIGNVCKTGDTCGTTCLNGGSCTNGLCVCGTGYGGEHCERVLDPCSSNPCLRGTCFHHMRQYHCLCPSGFTGKKCEINSNECISQPCQNGGRCVDNVGSFSCNCSSGFAGNICENDMNECVSQPCLNGGFCKDSIDQFLCQCRTGFDGDRCQNVADPCMKNPCVRGSCFSHLSQFLCECPSGYTGKLCDKSIQLSLNGPVEAYLKVPRGSEVLLNCNVSGLHPPNFNWLKLRACYSKYSNNKGSTLNILHATLGDAGTYMCTASDGYSANVTSYFHVEVTSNRTHESCNFDDGSLCGWSQQTNDSFDWSLINGPTQSDGTGPDADHTLGTSRGKYLFIESSSPRRFSEYAELISPILPANRTICFEFWYYMFGDGTGRLFVLLQDTCLKKETQLFNQNGDQGQRWNRADITVTNDLVPNDYRVVIKADVGATFHGDTSIDDLVMSDGPCKGNQGVPIVG